MYVWSIRTQNNKVRRNFSAIPLIDWQLIGWLQYNLFIKRLPSILVFSFKRWSFCICSGLLWLKVKLNTFIYLIRVWRFNEFCKTQLKYCGHIFSRWHTIFSYFNQRVGIVIETSQNTINTLLHTSRLLPTLLNFYIPAYLTDKKERSIIRWYFSVFILLKISKMI